MSILSERLKACLIPQKSLTVLAGLLANCTIGFVKNNLINLFIRHFKVNMAEACREHANDYQDFNDFFTRHLKKDARSIADSPVISPVDGVLSICERINHNQLLQAKGVHYTLETLLADKSLASHFLNGFAATFYLSPKDYHRIHAPMDMKITKMTHVPGKLFSVNPKTAEAIDNLFARNERLIVSCETSLGQVMMILVGATIVGAIGTSWHGDIKRKKTTQTWTYESAIELKKGDEFGYFKLGSTVIMLFQENDSKPIKIDSTPCSILMGQPLN